MGFNILCCFYSEFHTEKGAEILFQYPENYIKGEDFMIVSEYVIPPAFFCESYLAIRLDDTYLLGFPISLTNSNYERAKFQFNFCFLVSQEEYEKNYLIYEFLLKKIGRLFETFEIDSDYDFLKNNRSFIQYFLEKLYNCMIHNNEIICIDLEQKSQLLVDSIERKYFFFYFKYLDFSKAKSQILPYQVPVWIKSLDKEDIKNFENILKIVIHNIDGISFVKKIANKSELELNYVIYILYNLVISDCICMVDIFQFSNIYRANFNMKSFSNVPMKEEFRNFCKLNSLLSKNFKLHKNLFDIYNPIPGYAPDDEKSIDFFLDNLDDAKFFSFYCQLSVSKDVNNFLKKTKNFGMFISFFIAFGIYKKIIRRVHVYVLEKNKEIKDLKENKEYNNNDQKRIFLGLLDGKHCLDEVCCETNQSLKEVEAIIKQIDGIIIIYK